MSHYGTYHDRAKYLPYFVPINIYYFAMNKATLSDNSGRWFDKDSAKVWRESAIPVDDGKSISRITGNSWEHEMLYFTTNGFFVAHFFDDHHPDRSQYVELNEERAVRWLLASGYNEDIAGKYRMIKQEESIEI